MKKILAVLLVLAMVLSVSAVAFAETNSYLRIKEQTDETTGKVYSQGNFSTPITAGETVSFDFRPASATKDAWEEVSIRAYHYAAKWVYIKAVYDAENDNAFAGYEVSFDGCAEGAVSDVVVTQGADGWYNVSFKVAADQADGFFVRFASSTDDATKNYCDVDNLKVGSKTCSFNTTNFVATATNDIDLTFDDGTAFDYVQDSNGYDFTGEILTEEVTVDEPTVDTTEDATETEDTADVEETGVVSVAVAAVVAVIGGAVVLKKREF